MTAKITAASLLDQDSRLIRRLSLLTGIVMAILSSISIVLPKLVYPNPEIAQSFQANDLVNIIIGLPMIFGSLWLIRSDKIIGWLLLPGALVYVIYNYLAYVFGRPFDLYSVFCLGLVLIGSYTLVTYLHSLDHEGVKQFLEKTIPVKFPGWTLIIFGAGFFFLACYQIITGLINGSIPPIGEQAVSLADMVVSGMWFMGGLLLLQRKAPGYTLGLGLLFVTCTLFLGLILFFFIAPILTDRPFDLMEVIQVSIMGLISFVPTGLFWRGVTQAKNGYNME